MEVLLGRFADRQNAAPTFVSAMRACYTGFADGYAARRHGRDDLQAERTLTELD
jgi:hypothetical protein